MSLPLGDAPETIVAGKRVRSDRSGCGRVTVLVCPENQQRRPLRDGAGKHCFYRIAVRAEHLKGLDMFENSNSRPGAKPPIRPSEPLGGVGRSGSAFGPPRSTVRRS